MDACYCDYDPATWIQARRVRAKVAHKCGECGRSIAAGTVYERVAGVWGSEFDTFIVCGRCASMRDYVEAHVPCLCWAYGHIMEDVIETARERAHEAPGLLFGAWRRYLSGRIDAARKEKEFVRAMTESDPPQEGA